MRAPLRLLILVPFLAFGMTRAESWEYTISVPDGLPATFELPFPVEHAGTVVIEADWVGPRLLFFGVDAPGHPSYARRSGPSPQRLELPADGAAPTPDAGWKLTIKALAARGGASGRLRITVPDAPDVVARREADLHPAPPPPPPPPAWAVPRTPPADALPELLKLYAAVENYRASVVPAAVTSGDACLWQTDYLVFVTMARDRLTLGGAPLDDPTLRYFARLAEAIRQVGSLRSSTDPVLAGPVPEDVQERRAWLLARYELVHPIERSLDELNELLRSGHAPALEEERWLPRLIACLTACERHFDERVRLGADSAASNGDLAAAQWERIRAAGGVLEAFDAFLKAPSDLAR